jgi:NDP-sugar pyrophosphorylase family protein
VGIKQVHNGLYKNVTILTHKKGDSVKALILAGGFATRLRPLSCARPKTLFPIVNKPLLQWIFERLANSGVDDAILAVNALTQFYIRQQRPPTSGLKVRFSIDPPKMPLGTAGPIKKAEKLIGHDLPFLVINGDIYSNIDYREMLQTHQKSNAFATIALSAVDNPWSFGVAELANDNCVKRFIEKPAKGTSTSNLINAGVYVLNPEIFDYIPEGRAVSMEREIFPILVEEGKLCGHCINGLWMDIGTPEDYLEANKILLDSLADVLTTENAENFQLKKPVALDKGISVGPKSVIGPYAIIGKDTKVGKNVHIKNSVIFAETQIDDFAEANGAIVGEGARIGKHVKLGKGCIVGDQAKVKDGVPLPDGLAICPAKEVTEKNLKANIDFQMKPS